MKPEFALEETVVESLVLPPQRNFPTSDRLKIPLIPPWVLVYLDRVQVSLRNLNLRPKCTLKCAKRRALALLNSGFYLGSRDPSPYGALRGVGGAADRRIDGATDRRSGGSTDRGIDLSTDRRSDGSAERQIDGSRGRRIGREGMRRKAGEKGRGERGAFLAAR